MKPSFALALIAPACLAIAQCDETPQAEVLAPAAIPVDRHSLSQIIPTTDLLPLPYVSNVSSSVGVVNHTMKYPSVLLETIASVVNVDCSNTSVRVTFNDSTVFEASQSQWSRNGSFVLVTNHLGDCDVELERGFFLVDSLSWDSATLVATASSNKTDIANTAAVTKILFGQLPTGPVSSRDIVLDPTYTFTTSFNLPSTVLYTYSPYVTVTADTATFASNVTFSGYLSYNWLTIKVDSLYFDLDISFTSSLSLSAEVTSAYNTTFTYSPSSLYYGISIPGIVELGPELIFAVSAEVAASEAVTLTTDLNFELSDGNVHLDLLDGDSTTTSGWVPTYSISADISGQAIASLNPVASLTVELAVIFFGGLLDLSSGVTARPGFDNTFMLTADESADLTGVKNVTINGTCAEGLELESTFTFGVRLLLRNFGVGRFIRLRFRLLMSVLVGLEYLGRA